MKLKKIFQDIKNPIWLMRQAGRYLPEYLEIRSKTKNFLNFCYNPDLVSKATLQPINRFDLDAAIIFSDILVIPDALGLNVKFEESIGPILSEIKNISEIPIFKENFFLDKLNPVYEGIIKTKATLPKNKPLIGFVGAPWTISTYMIEGKGSKTFNKTKELAYNNPDEFKKIIDLLVETCIIHLKNQIKAGVDIIQIFDSWSGTLDEENFYKWVILPTTKIVKEIKKSFPLIPIIGFPKGANIYYKKFIEETKIDIIGLDSNLNKKFIEENINKNIITQGNLDPIYLLLKDKKILKNKIENILYTFKDREHIFNLGHGILPTTPIDNVHLLIKTIREYE